MVDFGLSVGGATSASKSGLSAEGKQLLGETEELRKTFWGQLLELLQTGGIGAQIPIIGQAEEQSRKATSKALSDLTNSLATSGLAGTPYGERAEAEARVQGESSVMQNIMNVVMQMFNAISGATTGLAGTIAGVPESTATSKSEQKGGSLGGCCFIFIASHGYLHPIVRRYRDEHMTVRNRRGYCWLSDRLVPLMAKYRIVKFLVDLLMVSPMTTYGKAYYGYAAPIYGFMYEPVVRFWMGLFAVLGKRPPYQRRGTEEVV
jgi:hypothetical protein